MKTQKTIVRGNGFTLIELMVVVLIIVILSAITIASLPGIQNKINRGKVESFLAELQSGLDRFEIDNGLYPLNEPSGDDPSARESQGVIGSEVLYKYLSGDFDVDGELFDNTGERDSGDDDFPIYITKLNGDYNEDANDKKAVANPSGAGYVVVDSYNSQIRYLAEKPNSKSDKLTKNPTYDIWSIVDTDPSKANDSKTQAKYITNWRRN